MSCSRTRDSCGEETLPAFVARVQIDHDYDQSLFINRELSWLEFNARVLHEAFVSEQASRAAQFLAIFSTNLDESTWCASRGSGQVATGARLTPPTE